MDWSRVPADLPEEVRPWAEQLRALAAAAGLPSQRKLAAALHVGTATMSRYLSAERLPDRSTVDRLVELARQGGGAIDEPAVLRAYAVAEKVFADRRRRNRMPAESGDVRNDRGRILRKAGVAAAVAVVGIGIAAFSGAFTPDAGQTAVPADVECVADSCTGKNHRQQGCDKDVRALASRDEASAIVEVMYSPTCQAAWAKAKGAPAGAVIKISDTDGMEQHAREKATSTGATRPTLMLSAPVGARFTACVTTDQRHFCAGPVEVTAE